MVNLFLTNSSLKGFIESTKLAKQDKEFLLSKLPELDEEERIKLFNLLKEVYFIDRGEKEAIEKIKNYWEK